jgi:hypothetical protein
MKILRFRRIRFAVYACHGMNWTNIAIYSSTASMPSPKQQHQHQLQLQQHQPQQQENNKKCTEIYNKE